MVRLQTEQESGEFAGVVYGRFRCSGSKLLERLRHVPFILRMAAVAVLVVILARPQSTNSWQNSSTEGIDIVLAMDISTSMMAQDLKPNRLEASKDVASAFIN